MVYYLCNLNVIALNRSMFVFAVTFNGTDMLDLARALKQLSESPRSSLTELTVSVLPHTELVDTLLEASPNLTSLCVELLTGHWTPVHMQHRRPSAASGLPGAVKLLP